MFTKSAAQIIAEATQSDSDRRNAAAEKLTKTRRYQNALDMASGKISMSEAAAFIISESVFAQAALDCPW